jgi:hypothetical protein
LSEEYKDNDWTKRQKFPPLNSQSEFSSKKMKFGANYHQLVVKEFLSLKNQGRIQLLWKQMFQRTDLGPQGLVYVPCGWVLTFFSCTQGNYVPVSVSFGHVLKVINSTHTGL